MVDNFWSNLLHQLQNNHQVFLALVASHTKGSPGTTGAKMFISETGEIQGTIGGGIMEYKIVERAQKILQQSEKFIPEIQTIYHRDSGAGEKSGLICGGSQTNLYYLCRPQVAETIQQLVSILEQDIAGSLCIQPEGMFVEEKAIDLTQPQILLTQESRGWVYQEQLLNRQRIAILGGGHCSLALSKIMNQLGYQVLVFDCSSEMTTSSKNIYAGSLKVVKDYQAAGALIPFPHLTCVVVMTTDFIADVRSLLGVVSLPFPFIGVMGSPAKIARIFQELRQAGLKEEALACLYAPVGLAIGSHTPEEIAVSVAAQILQERRRWEISPTGKKDD